MAAKTSAMASVGAFLQLGSAVLGQLVPQPQNKDAQERTKHEGDEEWTSTRLDLIARQNTLRLEMFSAESCRLLVVVCSNQLLVQRLVGDLYNLTERFRNHGTSPVRSA